jgi:hypothetical protein
VRQLAACLAGIFRSGTEKWFIAPKREVGEIGIQ